MNTKSILLIAFLLCGLSIYSDTDKYRLILTDDPATTITVGWNQVSGTNPVLYFDTIDYGTTYTSYAFSQTVDRVMPFKGMSNQFVRLTGLTPNTNYYFVINDDLGTSQRFWFKTAPDDDSRLSLIAGGDSRNNILPRQNANSLVSKLKPHAVLFGGDMTDTNSSGEWQDWFDDWQLTTATDGRMFPIIPTRGNHETDASTIYHLFDTPNTNSYYAITFGDDLIRVYTLNSEISVLGSQLTWLQNDLAASSSLTWKMAQYHKPMRPHAGWKAENNNQYDAWAQLFYDEEMRLVVECDSHLTKTTWPVKPSSDPGNDEGFVVEQTNGTVYTGEGCWGAPLRPNDDDKSWTRNSGSFNQFKLIFVESSKIELRTINVNNASLVGEVSNTDPFTLPINLNLFTPSTGAVVTISNSNDISCPLDQTPCDDGDSNTAYDVEDGSCNCIGLLATDLIESNIPVATSNDDAEELLSTGSIDLLSSDLELINEAGDQVVGIRFENVQVPLGAILERAYIQFETDEIDSTQDPTNLTIHGELSPASTTFSSSNGNISNTTSRPRTTNSIQWNNIKPWGDVNQSNFNQRTPNIKLITEEIINQAGWTSGNAITFFISGSGRRVAESYDGTSAPILKLIYRYDCPIDSILLGTTSDCDPITNTYSQEIIINYSNPPTSGNLIVNGQSFAIGSSPQTVSFTGLNADGFEVDVTAYFSTEPSCIVSEESFYEAPSNCSNDGIPDNLPNDNTNLALVPDATLSGSVTNGRGTVETILYSPDNNDYHTVTNWNEYGVNFNENIGKPSVNDGLKWQVNWQNVKYINYITFGGSYPNQPQPNTMWRISYRKDGTWTILAQGQGGWIDDGIFEWGGANINPIEADALKVQLYSDGINDVISVHLRGRGGVSNSINDSSTATKATLIQYLSPGNSCGVTMPTGSIVYCNGSWIYSDGPDESSGNQNTIIADGTYIIDVDKDVEVNDLDISSGATVEVKEGGSLIVNGNLTNNGSLELESKSTKYSSLIVEGTSTGSVSYNRHVNSYNGITGNDLVSSPFTGQSFGNFSAANPNLFENPLIPIQKLFGPFNESIGNYINYSVILNSLTILDNGVGFRAARDASEDVNNGTTLTFTGNVETGGFTLPITESATSFSGWNLIGNPYPSYIDFETFYNLNKTQLDGSSYQAIYGYDGDAKNGWTILNNLSSYELIAPGQGFFVKSKSGGGNISFTPDIRIKGATDDFILGRSTSNNMGEGFIQIDLNNTALETYSTRIYFNNNASLGLDPGYDAALFGGNAPDFSIYSNLVQGNTGALMAIQAVGITDINDMIIPLGINALQGQEVTVSITDSTIPNTTVVYLEDKLTNTFTILNDQDYTFTALDDISGIGRFYLNFEANSLNTIEQPLASLKIYTDKNGQAIIISGQLINETKFNLFDISGRLVKKQVLDSSSNIQTVEVSQLNAGIYIVELLSKSSKLLKKVVIN